jgi:type IV secretory system VirB8-like protein
MLDNANAWMSGEPNDESRKLIYEAALAKQKAIELHAKAVRAHGLIFGLGALVYAGIATLAAAYVYYRVPPPNPLGYALIDGSEGAVVRPVPARDAPSLFTEAVRRRAIRDFIAACEGYVPQTWVTMDWHNCMVHATPAEQKRREADIGQFGPRFPAKQFGQAGWAMPSQFFSFVKLKEDGTDTNRTYEYEIRYERTEVINGGKASRPHYTARVTFAFHPELKESDADRLLNETGFQAISFSTVKD